MKRNSRSMHAAIVIFFASIYASFISVTWGGKPQTYHDEYGYAMLENSSSYGIWNDDAGQYMDINKGGEDLIELEIYNSNKALRSVHVFLGKPELPYRSSRRVEFEFPIYEITAYDTYYSNYLENKAVYDILKSAESYFCDDIIHADISVYPGSKLRVQFVVDPGCTADSPQAITQSTVDDFYADDADPTYWTARIAEPSPEVDAHDHIIYTLYYELPFSVTGTYPTFTIETSGYATLAVGRLKGRKSGSHEIVHLAEYDVPFRLTVVSLGMNAAPRKHDTLSTTWGEIKY